MCSGVLHKSNCLHESISANEVGGLPLQPTGNFQKTNLKFNQTFLSYSKFLLSNLPIHVLDALLLCCDYTMVDYSQNVIHPGYNFNGSVTNLPLLSRGMT
jgi:hypothetical protein